MKKRLLAVLLCAVMAFSMAGCKEKKMSNEYVTINKYAGIEIEQIEKEEITDEAVEQQISGNLEAAQTREEVTDRAAETGDTVNIDYTGSIDGVEFDGGSAEGADLELGSGSFIGATEEYAGFEDQIVGHNTGEEFDITVQFPAEYSNNPDLANAVAVFHIKLNEIYKMVVPELTDEWVAENSEESKTVDEYKEEVRAYLEEQSEKSWETSRQTAMLDAFMEQVVVKKLPQEQIDEQYQSIEDYYTSMAQMYGMEFADILNSMGMDEDSFKEKATESAQNSVKRTIACQLLAEKLELEPTEEVYQERIKEYAEDYGYEDDIDAFKEDYTEDVIRDAILQETVINYLLDHCVEVEQSDDAEEAE